ncbi:MAG: FG-GAP-like repeat-containing protein [Bacteroidia bacterium]
MKNFLQKSAFVLAIGALSVPAFGQIAFEDATERMFSSNNSGCSMTIVDWNGDGLDDIIRLDQGRTAWVSVQRVGNTYENIELGQMASGSAWAMAAGDFDKNGYVDIVGGWNGSCKILMTNSDGTPGSLITLPQSNFFLQNITVIDANNDGWLDLFTCDDNGESSIYMNDGTGSLAIDNFIMDFDVSDTDDSGNYGSVWTDFDLDGDLDLYIAKCRQGVNSPTDGRRINVMFENNGDGTYTENAEAYNLNVGWQSWTASFGDIDNDGDFDLLLTNHDFQSQILENDGNNVYTDITETTGFDITNMTPIESMMEDFDNDGYLDLIISGSSHRFYKNNGDKTFTMVEGLFNNNGMLSFATGDLNHDGKVDLFAGYGNIYTTPTNTDDVVWLNTTSNNNHFFTLDLQGTVSNSGAIGAHALIYGSWGVQIREVRAGESYGTVNTAMLHFGLGESTVIDSVVINWPSGISQTILNPSADQFLTVIENECVSAEAIITADGEFVLCAGQALTLNAPSGYEYLWSNGETTQSVEVDAEGEYNVEVISMDNNCAAQSRTIQVTQTPDETPAVTVVGENQFCEGGMVELQGPAGLDSYTWSTGAADQSIMVEQSGEYTLTIQGSCAEFTSQVITVDVVSPILPVAEDVLLGAEGSTILTASGSNVVWFEDEDGMILLGEGNSFQTPVISTEATYYVQTSVSFGGGEEIVGELVPSGSSFGQVSTNSDVFFNVNEDCTLKNVTVTTDTEGERKIDLFDENDVLLNTVTIDLPVGTTVVELNFELAPGSNYYLESDAATNQASIGSASPRLVRDFLNTGFPYPYNVGGALEITGTTFGETYFFYYYNWQVELASEVCTSDLVPVTVSVEDVTGIQDANNQLQISPNPASNFLRVSGADVNASFRIFDTSGRLVDYVNSSSNGVISVDSYPAGMYILQVISKNKISTHKFTKN